MANFRIEIRKGDSCETIEFPIKPTNSTKAILVEFDKVNAWVWNRLFATRGDYSVVTTPESLPNLLKSIHAKMHDELVAVRKAGKGPTEKSHKFKVDVLREKYVEYRDPDNPEYEHITKTMTLGWFGITEIEGEFFANRKMVKKNLAGGCILPSGDRAYLALKPVLEAAAERVAQAAEVKAAEKAKRLEERNAIKTKQQEEANAAEAERKSQKIKVLLPVVAKEGDGAIEFCKTHYTVTDMQRKLKSSYFSWQDLPACPVQPESLTLKELELINAVVKISKAKIKLPDRVLAGSTVKWVDWVGPASKRQRLESECENCTVRFFGSKRVILCPDGDEIVKMAGPNLQISGGVELKS